MVNPLNFDTNNSLLPNQFIEHDCYTLSEYNIVHVQHFIF